MEEKGELTQTRKITISHSLWPLAHWIAKTNLKEATEVYKWILELNPSFLIPEKGAIGFLYGKLGFEKTEKLLSIRRKLKFGLWN
jgi:hypothetical protein